MEPEKFENNVKKVLGEREIQPSAAAWEKLEQRLEEKREKRPYFAWIASAVAIAAIFFVLGSYFDAPIASEEPQFVEKPSEEVILEEKKSEPEVIQLAASEEEKVQEEKKPSAERSAKNTIFETPVLKASSEETAIAEENSSEVKEETVTPEQHLIAEAESHEKVPQFTVEVSDHEVEALLLLASAELKSDSTYTVNAGDLLHQVEYELDQSFRQKVFEVVKDGLKKAKTAVANRDF